MINLRRVQKRRNITSSSMGKEDIIVREVGKKYKNASGKITYKTSLLMNLKSKAHITFAISDEKLYVARTDENDKLGYMLNGENSLTFSSKALLDDAGEGTFRHTGTRMQQDGFTWFEFAKVVSAREISRVPGETK